MIRIISKDGTGIAAEFIDTETGQNIGKSLYVEYGAAINMGHVVSAQLTLHMVEVDVVAGRTEWSTKNPITGNREPLALIEFKDGTKVKFGGDGTPLIEPPSAQPLLDITDAGLAQGERPNGALAGEKSPLSENDHGV